MIYEDPDWSCYDVEPDWSSDYEEQDIDALHQFMTVTDDIINEDLPPRWDTSDSAHEEASTSGNTKIRWNLIFPDGEEEEMSRPIFDEATVDDDEEEYDFEERRI
ncbi:hypothetical protein Cni_G07071 [Canna indica]|uniref:Uncharacterized protein n=1 Tax=Canna indica TaxID=4628 RepID=A0AAQ3K309_9LILI|nr:hypothetical protein Cni_G07071 [Canna indica]